MVAYQYSTRIDNRDRWPVSNTHTERLQRRKRRICQFSIEFGNETTHSTLTECLPLRATEFIINFFRAADHNWRPEEVGSCVAVAHQLEDITHFRTGQIFCRRKAIIHRMHQTAYRCESIRRPFPIVFHLPPQCRKGPA